MLEHHTMTDRKPPGVDFGPWVEHKIREATERGAFDNLPGAGKPIPDLDKPHDELWWIKRKLRDEQLAWLPADDRPAQGGRGRAGRRRPGRLRGRGAGDRGRHQRQNRRGQPQGRLRSPAQPGPFDPERMVARWRAAREG
jgi:hypothetical protein